MNNNVKVYSYDSIVIGTGCAGYNCAIRIKEAEKKSRQYIAKFNKLNEKCKIIICGCASENNIHQFEDKNIHKNPHSQIQHIHR